MLLFLVYICFSSIKKNYETLRFIVLRIYYEDYTKLRIFFSELGLNFKIITDSQLFSYIKDKAERSIEPKILYLQTHRLKIINCNLYLQKKYE